jgi:hypothetical protein
LPAGNHRIVLRTGLWGGLRLIKAPADILSILDAQGEDFQPEVYLEHFAPYHWTYVAGYGALLDELLVAESGFRDIKAVVDYVKGQRGRAIGLVPKSWRERFPRGSWEDCNGSQILKASGGQPMRLDKVCQGIKSLEFAFTGAVNPSLRELDIYQFIRLRPAIYVLRDLDAKQKSLLQATRLNVVDEMIYKALIEKVCAVRKRAPTDDIVKQARSFLALAADGYATTWNNAQFIRRCLKEVGYGHVVVEVMQGRTDGGRKVGQKGCNTAESLFVSLDEERMAILRKLAPSKATAR